MANIREIAKIAGVSAATVSRVINGTAKVDESKKDRILEAIKETGYQPNELARALYKQSSNIIGLIVPDIVNPFFSEFAKAAEESAHKNGFNILLCNSNNNARKELKSIDLLTRMQADGIILITNNDETGEMVKNCKLPVIVVDRRVEGGREIALIESDHYEGGRLATQCLIDKGCKNIVCMRGPQGTASGRLRFSGYEDVCRESGITVHYVDTEYDYESGEKSARELIEKFPDVEGIVAANDMVALSAYKVVTEFGKNVPKDISIVGFDDIGICKLVTPAITTIHQQISEMGVRAIDIICSIIHGEPYEKENIFKVELIERGTTN